MRGTRHARVVRIRPRNPADVEACVDILRVTHQTDGYPLDPTAVSEDFVVRRGEMGAWVADVDGVVAGHVSLQHPSDSATFRVVHDATGLDREALALVSALFASVTHRHTGVGRALLGHATQAALDEGLRPMLDVGKTLTAAIRLYERAGWVRVGEVVFHLAAGPFAGWVYLGPAVES